MRMKPVKFDPELEAALEKARAHVMTPEERRAQRISFAYGNAALDNPSVTREMVEKAAEELDQEERRRP